MPPLRPKLFIVSSSQSKNLATALAEKLNESAELNAESWARPDNPENNKQILTTLLDRSKTCDFAVVILTGDDTRTDVGRGEVVEVPRANCIFELGLFIGAFGRPERCFLLSSLDHQVLTSHLCDLGGQIYHPITEPSDFTNKAACRVAADNVKKKILDVVKEHKRFADRPHMPGYLIEDVLEREEDPHKVKDDDLVLVKENHPVERKLRYAHTVMNNMRRPVNYLYLFGAKQENYSKIIEMLRSMLATEVLRDEEFEQYETEDNEYKLEFLRGKGNRLSKAIQRMRKHMFIELINDIEFDEFCIHSAGRRYGQGFLKIDDRYVPVPARDALLRYEHTAYKAKKRWPTQVIFEPNALEDRQKAGIELQIMEKFPEDLSDQLISACFEREDA